MRLLVVEDEAVLAALLSGRCNAPGSPWMQPTACARPMTVCVSPATTRRFSISA